VIVRLVSLSLALPLCQIIRDQTKEI